MLYRWSHWVCVWRRVGGQVNVGLGCVTGKDVEWGIDGDLKVPPLSGFFVVEFGKAQHNLHMLA